MSSSFATGEAIAVVGEMEAGQKVSGWNGRNEVDGNTSGVLALGDTSF
jgi:hypothetical protein